MTSSALRNSYKGLMYNFYLDLKKVLKIGTIIVVSLTAFDFFISAIVAQYSKSSASENSGTLIVGFAAMLIALCIHMAASTSRYELRSKFAFPITRRMYALVNLITIALGALAMMMVLTIVAPIEMALYQLLSLFSVKLMFFNEVTLGNYLIGFASSWLYMVTLASVVYMMMMFIRRYMIPSLVVLALTVFSLFTFGWIGPVIGFLFAESRLWMLALKLLLITGVAHGLAYIPMKNLEVV